MSLKDTVLLMLEQEKDKALSGQEIADTLHVSRAAVWKAINSLKSMGYEIDATSNKGYCLKKSPDHLSEAFIEDGLKESITCYEATGATFAIKVLDETPSTNEELKYYVSQGENRDFVLIANHQTKGKGRRGRSFYSPAGTGLYLSFLLHPDMTPDEAPMLTTLAATATAVAIDRVCDQKTGIKWVNDIYLNQHKICGILTEASFSMEEKKLQYVIVGIGVNVYEPEGGFPEEIRQIAGSIFDTNKKPENLRNRLSVAIVQEFLKYYMDYKQKTYFSVYREKSLVLGREILVLPPGLHGADLKGDMTDLGKPALALSIDDECHLKVQYKDGRTEVLSNGEISIKL